MSDAFSDRLRAAGIAPDAKTDERRRAEIETFAADSASGHTVDLVRIAFQRQPAAAAAAEALLAVLNAGDGSPEVRLSDEYLLALLACQTLIELFARGPRNAIVQSALLVESARFVGWEPAHPDVVDAAGVAIRKAASDSSLPPTPPRLGGQPATTKQALEGLATADWAPYRTAIEELSAEIARLRSYTSRLSAHIAESQEPMREQQELLWWVVSGYSLTAGCPLRQVPVDAAPCIVARDLAQISPGLPGPVAVDAFLEHGLRQANSPETKSLSVDVVTSAIRDAGLAPAFPHVPEAIADLLPVLSALQSGNVTETDRGVRDVRAVARQTYNEIMLASHEF